MACFLYRRHDDTKKFGRKICLASTVFLIIETSNVVDATGTKRFLKRHRCYCQNPKILFVLVVALEVLLLQQRVYS